MLLGPPQPPLASDSRAHSLHTALLHLPEAAFQRGTDLLHKGYLEHHRVIEVVPKGFTLRAGRLFRRTWDHLINELWGLAISRTTQFVVKGSALNDKSLQRGPKGEI